MELEWSLSPACGRPRTPKEWEFILRTRGAIQKLETVLTWLYLLVSRKITLLHHGESVREERAGSRKPGQSVRGEVGIVGRGGMGTSIWI